MDFALQSYMFVDFNDSKMYGHDAKGGLYFHSYCKFNFCVLFMQIWSHVHVGSC